ncbi:52 kDa repressor of the inhibitor of the protein kinase-like isoform X7 [Bacillus rossius redtenbacheri]|uniref:52 kDa repressor of the inhibitor of the protein kinase-like isoform X7 n=1 Tax=Bacillus rossius redtenbacheri TaxID=93214 RepID=UPI002FDE132B
MEKTRKRYGATWCSAPNCSNNSDQLEKRSFFRFPKDELLCRKWVVECRRSDLEDKSAAYLYKNCRICSDHFEHVMFLNDLKNRRHSHAVPTLFNVPKPPCIQSLKKQGEYNEIQPEIRRLIPGLSTDNARTEEYTTPNLTMETEDVCVKEESKMLNPLETSFEAVEVKMETDGVHVKEEPVMADSFETVFVTVKEEVEVVTICGRVKTKQREKTKRGLLPAVLQSSQHQVALRWLRGRPLGLQAAWPVSNWQHQLRMQGVQTSRNVLVWTKKRLMKEIQNYHVP